MSEKLKQQIVIHRNGFDHLQDVLALNQQVFHEDRIINRLDHDPLIFLTAHCDGRLVGFKIGYALNRDAFYSAKSATAPLYRKRGVARRLLFEMLTEVSRLGFQELQYDTFPRLYPGMLVLGLRNGFRIKNLGWHKEYDDFQLRLTREINPA